MAALTTQTVNRTTGQTLTTAAATTGAGDTWTNTGSEFLYINNASGGSITVTVTIPLLVDGVAISTGKQFTVGATTIKLIGPFPTSTYTDTNGNATVTYSAVTSVTVAAIRFNQTS